MRRLLLKLFRRRRLAEDLEAELDFHREMAAAQDNTIPLGHELSIREQALDLWRFNFLENLWRDVVYAARGLRRSPGLVFSALLSLGLGIGVNTAIFSLAVEFLLSEPSVRDASSIVAVGPQGDSHSRPVVLEAVRDSGIFQDIAGENAEAYTNWNDGQETRRVFAVQGTQNYFTTLGVPVAHGRGWTADDPKEVAVLSHRFWSARFNRDLSILGRAVQLDGAAYTVIGILPEAHHTLLGYGYAPDVYIPLSSESVNLALYARLKPDSSISHVRAAMPAIGERLDQLDRLSPERGFNYARRMSAVPITGFGRIRQRNTKAVGLFAASLLLLVGLVLLIACINVAGLLIARASARSQEMAVRLALGASRGRLLQQLLTESLLLSFAGAGLGFLLAELAAKYIAAIRLPLPIPIELRIEPDWRVVTYAAILAIAATIVCGLLPAVQTLKDSLTSDLRREHRLRLRRALVVVQVAVSFVVLATGALFLQNLLRSTAIGPGFDVRQTLRAQAHLPANYLTEQRRLDAYVDQAIRELKAIPGIEAAAAARTLPFNGSTHNRAELTFTDNGEKTTARLNENAVSPEYFRAMDIPVLSGRPFTAEDRAGAKVVIVNKTFVERVLGNRTAVGAVFRRDIRKETYQIVGVVANTKNDTIGEDDSPQLYQPLSTAEQPVQFVIRSRTPPATQLSAIRECLRRIEPGAGLEVATMFSSIGLAFLPSQIGAALMGAVGILGLLLAAVGLNGVMAYSVVRRTREIGVRVAVGASRREISRMVLLESAKLLALGSAIGLAIALLVTKPLAVFFVAGLSPSDPLSFGSVLLVLGGTGLLATLGPIRRALAVDPMTALRYD